MGRSATQKRVGGLEDKMAGSYEQEAVVRYKMLKKRVRVRRGDEQANEPGPRGRVGKGNLSILDVKRFSGNPKRGRRS